MTTRSGLRKSVDGCSLLQEFGVADHAERVCRLAPNDVPDSRRRADRDRALVDDNFVSIHRSRERSRATPRTCRRSADPSSSAGVPTAMKMISDCLTARARAVVNTRRRSWRLRRTISSRPGSKIRDLAALERPDFRFVVVDTENGIAVLGETGTDHKPDVSGAHDGDLHDARFPFPAASINP